MSNLRNFNITTIGGGTPIVGTFGQLITAYQVRDIAVKWEFEIYDTNYDMLPADLTGDGSQSFDNGLLVASSAVTGTSCLKSRKVTRYRTGNGGFAWFTASFNSGTGLCYTGLESDNDDKIVIRENNGVIQFGYSRLGVDTVYVDSSSFNGDADVGSIDWTNLNIFQIRYGYLGTADLEIYISQNGKKVLLHKILLAGTMQSTHVRFPQFRMSSYAENGATVKNGSWAAGTFSNVLETRGEDPSARPFFDETQRTVVPSITEAPIVAYRIKDTYGGFTHSITAKLLLQRIASGSEGLYEFAYYFNPASINDGAWNDINTLSSVVEVNKTLTSFTGGVKRFAIPVAVQSQGTGVTVLSEKFEELGVFLNRGDSVVITIKEIISGGGSDIQYITFNWQELF